ncbi:hypothetical protein SUGI_0570300 [Cryptomeria japonica]|nr:hypothetical protein SUGI_0570300 [Cryptomeria japonica]
MSSNKENQFPFAFDAEFFKASMVMKAKVDEMYEEWKSGKEGLSKKLEDIDLVKSPHSSHCLLFSLGDSQEQSQCVGLRLLTKMGYKGKGLEIYGQGMVELVKVEARPCYAGLGYGEGECSKAVDANNSPKEEPSQEQYERRNGTSPSGGGDTCKMFKRRTNTGSSQHACTKGDHQRYNKLDYSNVPFDYKKVDNIESLWFGKPCTFCGLNNHSVSKCWKRMALYRKVKLNRKGTQHKYPSPNQRK